MKNRIPRSLLLPGLEHHTPNLKFTPGPTVASLSGSVGGQTYSRNRGGAYIRNRAIPITSTTASSGTTASRVE